VSWNHRIINNKTIFALFVLLTFYTIGCSTYFVPSESKVLVKKEDLASYNPKNFSKSKEKNVQAYRSRKLRNEDQLIIQAIFLEEQGAYKQSNEFYALLYKETKKEEYLLRELTTAYQAGISSPNLNDLKIYIQNNPKNLQAQRMLLSFYLKDKKFNKAKEVGSNLTQQSKQAVDFELAANPYIFSGEYLASLKYLQEAYDKTLNEDILLKIVTIQINYLQKIDDAIEGLENHREKEGCSEKICLQLIGIYSQQRKTSKLIPIYKDLYHGTKKEIYSEKIIESYLMNKNLNATIEYLEGTTSNNTLLYSLYMEQKSYVKANNLAKLLIKKTNNPKWYAESAISYYESLSNKDDKEQLKKIVANFEKAIQLGEKNPVYLNYYGYTLIDKEIDIKKGLDIIKKALAEEPGNTYFLDSLAWGHYKLDNCEKAYPTMKKVVEVEGLNEEEIIEHWNAINSKCKKN
jgi:predicted Zn-dependent protease